MTTAPHPDRVTQREAAGAAGGLFERHGKMVYGLCRAMLRDVHEAEDAAQQVFLSAYQALLRGAHVREPGAWLAAIARNECRARIADGMRRPLPVADEDLEHLPTQRDEHARRLQAQELRSALAALPERQREAVVLRYLYGLRYGDVATALGLSRPATDALLFRARRAMRLRLRPVVGAALVVPSVVRDELALALPGFGAGSGGGLTATGLTGGLLGKLAAGPVGVKAAAAVIAVSTVGIVGAVPPEHDGRSSVQESLGIAVGGDPRSASPTAAPVVVGVGGDAAGEAPPEAATGRSEHRRRTDGRPTIVGRGDGASSERDGDGSEHAGSDGVAVSGDPGSSGEEDSPAEHPPTPTATPSDDEPESADPGTNEGPGSSGHGVDASGSDDGGISPEASEATERSSDGGGSGSESGSSGSSESGGSSGSDSAGDGLDD